METAIVDGATRAQGLALAAGRGLLDVMDLHHEVDSGLDPEDEAVSVEDSGGEAVGIAVEVGGRLMAMPSAGGENILVRSQYPCCPL